MTLNYLMTYNIHLFLFQTHVAKGLHIKRNYFDGNTQPGICMETNLQIFASCAIVILYSSVIIVSEELGKNNNLSNFGNQRTLLTIDN